MKEPTFEQTEIWRKDPNNWKFGLFYYNNEDKRIIVTKRIAWMGITINFANPRSYVALLIIIGFFFFVVYMIESN